VDTAADILVEQALVEAHEQAFLARDGEPGLPPHAVVHGEPRADLPGILRIQADVSLPVIEIRNVALRPRSRLPHHEIRQRQACHRPVKRGQPRGVDARFVVDERAQIRGAEAELVAAFHPTDIPGDVGVGTGEIVVDDGIPRADAKAASRDRHPGCRGRVVRSVDQQVRPGGKVIHDLGNLGAVLSQTE